MKTTTIKTIEYNTKRNNRMQSYKGEYNCEIIINGQFAGDAQGDSASQAKHNAESTVRRWERAGLVVRG